MSIDGSSHNPLVARLRFARSEFARVLVGVGDEEGGKRLEPMNCISWMVGHLAVQEQTYWLMLAQGERLYPDLHKIAGSGSPPSSPPLAGMLTAWHDITAAADRYLATVDATTLETFYTWKEKPVAENVGTLLLRNTYHYWFHCGEISAIRQQLGHTDLPEFVGNMATVLYRAQPSNS